ncbi:hypothetical protein ACIQF5_20750 [Streptomyces goshikiensis]|uniref:hypothetical protein n=1 Tax=Streptomyces goshikiensis TaxID=1942 RepID=UPI0038060080
MDQSGVPSGFSDAEYDRVANAARVVGKSPEAFVRDVVLDAAADPFIDALTHTRQSITRLAPVFAEHSEEPRRVPTASFQEPAPLGSRDLDQAHRGHAA